jgi:hypothetical protein
MAVPLPAVEGCDLGPVWTPLGKNYHPYFSEHYQNKFQTCVVKSDKVRLVIFTTLQSTTKPNVNNLWKK